MQYISDNSTVGDWVAQYMTVAAESGTCPTISPSGGLAFTDCLEGAVTDTRVSLMKQPLCQFGKNKMSIITLRFIIKVLSAQKMVIIQQLCAGVHTLPMFASQIRDVINKEGPV